MATYKPIQSLTLTADTTTVTFSGIDQNYTDLEIVVNARGSAADNGNFYYRINGDATSSYTVIRLQGGGSSAVSNKGTANTVGYIGYVDGANTTSGIFSNTKIYVNNYSSSSTYKTLISKGVTPGTNGYAAYFVNGYAGSTSAVTSISFTPDSGNWIAGSTFSLYGIKSGAPQALGGDVVTTDGTYWYHAFRSTGAFTPLKTLTADVLVVAGGGGGGGGVATNARGGGGGAGGILAFASQSVSVATTVTIGAGGAGAINNNIGASGVASQFGSLTSSAGGGLGGSYGYNAGNGGSGGGGGTPGGGYVTTGGSASPSGQGNAGGTGTAYSNNTSNSGAGGGGAGAAGGSGSSGTAGTGGVGLNTVTNWGSLSSVLTSTGLGASGYLAGGGGGAGGSSSGAGGTGGGGSGVNNGTGTAGTANTGGGGGAAGSNSTDQTGGAGGSGIVIVRYAV